MNLLALRVPAAQALNDQAPTLGQIKVFPKTLE
jgi:hypothetical protein